MPEDKLFPAVFNHNTITADGELVFARLFTDLYPAVEFVEDARPDYYVLRAQFDDILKEVYGTEGKSIYRAYLSGKCLEIRLIEEHKTMFCVTFIIPEDLADRNYRLSSKDLELAHELGSLDDIQSKLDSTTAQEYNARELAPIILDKELTHAILRVFYYPLSEVEKSQQVCMRYNALKFDRTSTAMLDNAIYTLSQTNAGLSLNKHFLDTTKYKSDIIESNYNDSFGPAYEKIISFLKSSDNGLILLTGEPGTGKSSFLMHLTSVCKDLNTKFVFIPASYAGVLTDPTFLPFALSNLNNSVLIIEDAEEALRERSSYSNSAVSSILNVTDGILGKLVKVKIIATVNKEHILDYAITRKGRLKLQYEFKKLEVDKANSLFEKLGKEKRVTSPLILAEIYNEEDTGVPESKSSKRKIGF
jgi:energy-coupling factor transporter ATP-binding protein EcfA2